MNETNDAKKHKITVDLGVNEGIATIKVEGILNSENAYILQERLNEVLASEAKILELDFFDCRGVSSSGIGKILLFYKDFIGRGGEIEVTRCSNTVYELFSMLKINQLFTVNLG
jgi:anti-sigma B factor antagonist